MPRSGCATLSTPGISRLASWMNGASRMYSQATCEASPSAISSPALESGATPFGLPDGATIDLFGLAPVRANLSPRQAKELGLMTSGTSGRRSTISSRSARLQSSLESRLRAKTQGLGSTLYKMTWKNWVLPSGRSRSRLRASVLRTSGTAPTGWPTPAARDFKSGADNREAREARGAGGDAHAGSGASHGLAHAEQHHPGCQAEATNHREPQGDGPADRPGGCGCASCRLADPALQRWPGHSGANRGICEGPHGTEPGGAPASQSAGPLHGHWRDADWLFCRDGRWRPVEPGTFPLAHGAPARVGRLRAYGNAINAKQAQIFIECLKDHP